MAEETVSMLGHVVKLTRGPAHERIKDMAAVG
jgi:hypothetical protein